MEVSWKLQTDKINVTSNDLELFWHIPALMMHALPPKMALAHYHGNKTDISLCKS